jgi:hypothetical protein
MVKSMRPFEPKEVSAMFQSKYLFKILKYIHNLMHYDGFASGNTVIMGNGKSQFHLKFQGELNPQLRYPAKREHG